MSVSLAFTSLVSVVSIDLSAIASVSAKDEDTSSAAFESVGDINKVKPNIKDTKPIDNFLLAYFGFLVDPFSFFKLIKFSNFDFLSIISPFVIIAISNLPPCSVKRELFSPPLTCQH